MKGPEWPGVEGAALGAQGNRQWGGIRALMGGPATLLRGASRSGAGHCETHVSGNNAGV